MRAYKRILIDSPNFPERKHRWDFALLVLPIMVAIIAFFFGSVIDYSVIGVAVPIMSSLSLGLLVFVFQLRLDASSKFERGSLVLQLIDTTFDTVLFSTYVGFTCMCVGLIPSLLANSSLIARICMAVSLGITAHYLVILLLALKRFRAAYEELTR